MTHLLSNSPEQVDLSEKSNFNFFFLIERGGSDVRARQSPSFIVFNIFLSKLYYYFFEKSMPQNYIIISISESYNIISIIYFCDENASIIHFFQNINVFQ